MKNFAPVVMDLKMETRLTQPRSAASLQRQSDVHPTPPFGEQQGRDGACEACRVFKQFSWLEVGSGKMALSRPASWLTVKPCRNPPVPRRGITQTVRQLRGE
jgi:hypothetical protein